jgi:hypothetical protein
MGHPFLVVSMLSSDTGHPPAPPAHRTERDERGTASSLSALIFTDFDQATCLMRGLSKLNLRNEF